jgi:hypothetical protein
MTLPPQRRAGNDDESFLRTPDFDLDDIDFDDFDFDLDGGFDPGEVSHRINEAFTYTAPRIQAALPRLGMQNALRNLNQIVIDSDPGVGIGVDRMHVLHSDCPNVKRL